MTTEKGDHGPLEFTLIAVKKKPEGGPGRSLGGRPRTKVDAYAFEGPFSVSVLRINGRGLKSKP